MILYIFGHYDKALEVADEIVPQMSSLWSWRCTRVVYFYASLAITAKLRENALVKHKQDDLLRIAESYRAQIIEWQSCCEANYLMWSLLIQAEICELRNDYHGATLAYEAAVDHAELHGFNLELALTLESQSGFFVRNGARRAAISMLRDAIAVYSRFGAGGKVEQLTARNEFLLRNLTTARTRNVGVQTSTDIIDGTYLQLSSVLNQTNLDKEEEISSERLKAWINPGTEGTGIGRQMSEPEFELDVLDLTSILRFNQAISSELEVDKLLVKMTEIIISSTGSQATCVRVITEDGDRGWSVAVSGNLDILSLNVCESSTKYNLLLTEYSAGVSK